MTSQIVSADFELLPTSEITRSMNADEIIRSLESSLLLGRSLPADVRTKIANFLTTSETGAVLVPNFSDAVYVSKKIRGAVALVLSQPEYVLQSGYDRSPDSTSTSITPLSGTNNKLVFVELGG